MVFSSITFLFFFLPIVVGVVVLAPARLRNVLLLVASLAFYVWGSHDFVLVLVGTSIVDYALVDRANRFRLGGSGRRRNPWLIASIVLNLGVLGYFKYAGFFADSLPIGTPPSWLTDVVLPIGISFFTFQRISYAVDVATGREEPVDGFVDYLLYITLFPQLIAGPIVRYGEINRQLRHRTITIESFSDGVVRFSLGLCKKVLVADTIAPAADAVFDSANTNLSTTAAAIGVVAYTLQLYFDFSGYSDMAIGLGRMFGFRFPENFNRPYTSDSVTDFWRRWHMTLSRWFRDYLYIPLGGNRTGHTQRNLVIVFLLTGLWHGAATTFVVWGAYHGALLLIERRFGGRLLPGLAGRALTLVLVAMGWVVFRAPSLDRAADIFRALVSFDFGPVGTQVSQALDNRTRVVLVLACVVFIQPRSEHAGDARLLSDRRVATARRSVLVGLGLPAALLVAASQSFSPFLYFQF